MRAFVFHAHMKKYFIEKKIQISWNENLLSWAPMVTEIARR